MHWYEVISLGQECLVDVLEVARMGRKAREGWAYVHHLPGEDGVSVLRELFVVPSARRAGVGAALDYYAAIRARERGSKTLRIDLSEADDYGAAAATAAAFIQHRRYKWVSDTPEHPSTSRFAVRSVSSM